MNCVLLYRVGKRYAESEKFSENSPENELRIFSPHDRLPLRMGNWEYSPENSLRMHSPLKRIFSENSLRILWRILRRITENISRSLKGSHVNWREWRIFSARREWREFSAKQRIFSENKVRILRRMVRIFQRIFSENISRLFSCILLRTGEYSQRIFPGEFSSFSGEFSAFWREFSIKIREYSQQRTTKSKLNVYCFHQHASSHSHSNSLSECSPLPFLLLFPLLFPFLFPLLFLSHIWTCFC